MYMLMLKQLSLEMDITPTLFRGFFFCYVHQAPNESLLDMTNIRVIFH
jgi:hypothetical protein